MSHSSGSSRRCHTGPYRSLLPSILGRSGLPADFAQHREVIRAGQIYVPPPDHNMVLLGDQVWVNQGPKVHHTRPAVDPLFTSAAIAHRHEVMGVVLSGGDGDGASGLKAISKHGGQALVQHPDEAFASSMPNEALAADHPEVLLIEDIADRVRGFC